MELHFSDLLIKLKEREFISNPRDYLSFHLYSEKTEKYKKTDRKYIALLPSEVKGPIFEIDEKEFNYLFHDKVVLSCMTTTQKDMFTDFCTYLNNKTPNLYNANGLNKLYIDLYNNIPKDSNEVIDIIDMLNCSDFFISSYGNKIIHEKIKADTKLLKFSSLLTLLNRIRAGVMGAIAKPGEAIIMKSDYTVVTENNGSIDILTYINHLPLIIYYNLNWVSIKFNNNHWIGTREHLNLLFNMASVNMSLSIMECSSEFRELNNCIRVLENFMYSSFNWNDKVTFFKNFETMILQFIDLKEYTRTSIIDKVDTLKSIADALGISQLDIITIFNENYMGHIPGVRFIEELFYELGLLHECDLARLVCLHKGVMFAEVKFNEMLENYISRTAAFIPDKRVNYNNLKGILTKHIVLNYHSKHKELPNFSNETPSELLNAVKDYTARGQLKLLYLSNDDWSKLKFSKTLEYEGERDPLHIVNNKACTKNNPKNLEDLSIDEIICIIKSETIKDIPKLSELGLKRSERYCGKEINVIDDYGPQPNELNVRLVCKEKEQKQKGRLFGIAGLQLKKIISLINNYARKLCQLIETQNMTDAEDIKRRKLNRLGEKLRYPNTYALMMDLEGHNQRMTYENTLWFFEILSDIFGEPDLKLSHLIFENINVIIEHPIYGKKYGLKGQKGGIEGWMTFAWGAISSIILEEALAKLAIEDTQQLVYNDDMVAVYENTAADTMNYDLIEIADTFGIYGSKIKISATAISSMRITFLRTTYLRGLVVSKCIKLMLGTSIFTNDLKFNEELEIEALSSSISSVLTDSFELFTINWFKYFNVFLLTWRLFVKLIEYSINPKNTSKITFNFNQHTNSLLQFSNECIEELKFLEFDECKFDLTREGIGKFLCLCHNYPNDKLHSEIIRLFRTKLKYEKKTFLIKMLKSDEHNMNLYKLYLHLPCSLSGMSVNYLLNDSVSGYDINIVERLFLVNREQLANNSQFNIYGFLNSKFHTSIKNINVFNNLVPVIKTETTSKDIWLAKLFEVFKKEVKNIRLKDLLNLNKEVFQSDLVEFFRENLSLRLLHKYYELSPFFQRDIFLSKVEKSNVLIKLDKSVRVFRELYEYNNKKITLFCNQEFYNQLNIGDSIYQFVDMNQKALFLTDGITMINEQQPLILEALYKDGDDLIVKKHDQPEYTEGTMRYQKLFRSIKMKNKKYNDLIKIGVNINEYNVAELVRITKWILLTTYTDLGSEDSNVIVACNYILSYYTDQRFKDLQGLICAPETGLPAHRLHNKSFKDKAHIRISPNDSGCVNVIQRPDFVEKTQGEDSNLNYGLLYAFTIGISLISNQLEIKFGIQGHYFSDMTNVDYVKRTKFKGTKHDKLTNVKDFSSLFKFSNLEDMLQDEKIFQSLLISNKKRVFGGLEGHTLFQNTILQFFTLDKQEYKYINYYSDISEERIAIWKTLDTNNVLNDWTVSEIKNELKYLTSKDVTKTIVINMGSQKQRVLIELLITKIFEEYYAYYTKLTKKSLQILIETQGIKEIGIQLTCCLLLKIGLSIDLLTLKRDNEIQLDINKVQCSLVINKIESYHRLIRFINIYKEYTPLGLEEIHKVLTKLNINVDHYYNDAIDNIKKSFSDRIEEVQLTNLKLETFKFNTHYLEEKIELVNIEDQNTYIHYPGKLSDLTQLFTYLDKIYYMLETASCYTNTKVYESKTYSDAYHSQYQLFKTLIQCQLLNLKIDKVLDCTCGRGDGEAALSSLQINHKSIGREDIWDKQYSNPNLKGHRSNQYNILDFDTYRNDIDDYNIIYIDASHFSAGKGTGSLWNTIIQILNCSDKIKRRVIIRLNILNRFKSQIKTLSNFRIDLFLPGCSQFIMQHSYVMISQEQGIANLNHARIIENTKRILHDSATKNPFLNNIISVPTSVTPMISKEFLNSKETKSSFKVFLEQRLHQKVQLLGKALSMPLPIINPGVQLVNSFYPYKLYYESIVNSNYDPTKHSDCKRFEYAYLALGTERQNDTIISNLYRLTLNEEKIKIVNAMMSCNIREIIIFNYYDQSAHELIMNNLQFKYNSAPYVTLMKELKQFNIDLSVGMNVDQYRHIINADPAMHFRDDEYFAVMLAFCCIGFYKQVGLGMILLLGFFKNKLLVNKRYRKLVISYRKAASSMMKTISKFTRDELEDFYYYADPKKLLNFFKQLESRNIPNKEIKEVIKIPEEIPHVPIDDKFLDSLKLGIQKMINQQVDKKNNKELDSISELLKSGFHEFKSVELSDDDWVNEYEVDDACDEEDEMNLEEVQYDGDLN